MLKELVLKNRSYRRFDESAPVGRDVLLGLVDLARQTASAANRQPLKYLLSWRSETNDRIFPLLSWAGYLHDWPGPDKGERPSAYIVMLVDRDISPGAPHDLGIAAQTILLGATEIGLGGCMIASIEREALRAELAVPTRCDIALVIALGKPAEKVALETIDAHGDIRYWRDPQGVHHVPKRRLEDIIVP
ncbi:MAG: nitroreductase family protein [Pseudomonadota bacterium]|nr:nitroreductase family protein [Pseudomonadota bacterium]